MRKESTIVNDMKSGKLGIFVLLVCLLMFTGCGMSADKDKESGSEDSLINICKTV